MNSGNVHSVWTGSDVQLFVAAGFQWMIGHMQLQLFFISATASNIRMKVCGQLSL